MERRLLKAITTPAMVVTLLAGFVLATVAGAVERRLAAREAAAGACCCWPATASSPRHVRRFQGDERPKSATWYRVFNEVPTLLFIGIVLLAVLKPF